MINKCVKQLVCTIAILSMLSTWAFADDKAVNFRLLDQNGIAHELYYHAHREAIVLIWQGNGCPIIRQYYEKINKLEKKFANRNVQFFFINTNTQDNAASVASELSKYNASSIPVLMDEAQVVTKSLSVERTATALIIDPRKWTVAYRGAIDDRIGYEVQKKSTKNDYLKNALNQFLAGEQVELQETGVEGCAIYFEEDAQLTYVNDIAPILKQKCISCHGQGGFAPWSMDDYEKVRGWSAMMKEVILARRMPPYDIDQNYPVFLDDKYMAPDDVRKIIHWLDNGMLRGEGKDPLKGLQAKESIDWPEPPDHILTIPGDDVPAVGPVPYIYKIVRMGFEEDKWIRGIFYKPSRPEFVHHTLGILVPRVGTMRELNLGTHLRSMDVQYVGGYLPNFSGYMMPEGIAMKIPAGTDILVQEHYYPTGVAGFNQTEIGFYFYDGTPEFELKAMYGRNRDFIVPAGDPYSEATAELQVKEDMRLLGMTPHMHYRGKSMRFTLDYPDGSSEVILSVPNYNFNWQHIYYLDEDKAITLPEGTIVRADAVFDNSPHNRRNPDSTVDVGWGLKSEEEMFWFFFYGLTKYTP